MTKLISDKNLKNDVITTKVEIEHILEESKSKKIYEVIRIINSKPLFLEEHVTRFNKSIELFGLNKKYTYREILDMINKIIDSNQIYNNNIRMTYFYEDKHVLLLYLIKSKYPDKDIYENGVKTITLKKSRENPNIKIDEKNLRASINDAIEKENAFEAILLDENNIVSEGSRSNIFFADKDKIVTPIDKNVLLGVTRQKVIELCRKNNIYIEKRNISIDEIDQFNGAFITGTSINVLPIKQIDNIRYFSSNNKLIKTVSKLYKEEVINETK